MEVSSSLHILLPAVLLLLTVNQNADAQQVVANGVDKIATQPVQPGSPKFQGRLSKNCGPIREVNGVCTNENMKYWGSVGLPQKSYRPRSSAVVPSGASLPSARHISNVVCKQKEEKLSERGLSEFVTFFGQFLDHCIAATPKDTESFPIQVPEKDSYALEEFPNGQMPFTRSKRAKDVDDMTSERPMNSLPSAVDLAAVYGPENERLLKLRSFSNGKMLTSAGKNLPFNSMGLSNAPSTASSFFVAGDFRANENPVLISLHTIFLREHNRLARLLKEAFPHWKDEKLFQTARACNIVQFQRVVFEEFYPAMTGRRLPKYKGFDPTVNPTLTDVFTTAAYRIGHTMVGNVIQRRGPGMSPMSPLPMAEMFFKPQWYLDDGPEPYVRGAIDYRSQEVDIQVSDALRNFLFKNVPEEHAMDLVALNLQRGRDHNIVSYKVLQKVFRKRKIQAYEDVNPNRSVYRKLQRAYNRVGQIEAFIGLLAEPHVPGGSMGRTMLILWKKEFLRMRDGDRFFYMRRSEIFDEETRAGFKQQLDKIYEQRKPMQSIILRNTDIKRSELPPSIWFKKN